MDLTRFSRLAWIASGALALGTLAGCGASDAISEKAAEVAIEKAAESGGNGDVDVDIDAKSGEFKVTGRDGEAVIEANGDGEDGSFSIRTEDGEFSTRAGSLPDGFPTDVPLVDGEPQGGTRASEGGADVYSAIIRASGDDGKAVYEDAVAQLEGAGYTKGDGGTVAETGGGDETGGGAFFATAELAGPHRVVVSVQGAPETGVSAVYHVSPAE